jgi:hypothetical protein
MKVSTEIDNNFGYEKITQLVDNIPLMIKSNKIEKFIFCVISPLILPWIKWIKKKSKHSNKYIFEIGLHLFD